MALDIPRWYCHGVPHPECPQVQGHLSQVSSWLTVTAPAPHSLTHTLQIITKHIIIRVELFHTIPVNQHHSQESESSRVNIILPCLDVDSTRDDAGVVTVTPGLAEIRPQGGYRACESRYASLHMALDRGRLCDVTGAV